MILTQRQEERCDAGDAWAPTTGTCRDSPAPAMWSYPWPPNWLARSPTRSSWLHPRTLIQVDAQGSV